MLTDKGVAGLKDALLRFLVYREAFQVSGLPIYDERGAREVGMIGD